MNLLEFKQKTNYLINRYKVKNIFESKEWLLENRYRDNYIHSCYFCEVKENNQNFTRLFDIGILPLAFFNIYSIKDYDMRLRTDISVCDNCFEKLKLCKKQFLFKSNDYSHRVRVNNHFELIEKIHYLEALKNGHIEKILKCQYINKILKTYKK